MGKAPKPDPLIGQSALISAELGREMLAFMKGQAAITNEWAATDRARQQSTFIPLQDQYIADAQKAMNPATMAANAEKRSSEAVADVRQQFAQQRGADTRRLTAMGVSPDSGRFIAANRGLGTAEALAAAGASNIGRRQSIAEDEAKAETMRANAINLGSGLAVNPMDSIRTSNGATQAGYEGAMGGYRQQASLLQADYNSRMDAYNSRMGGIQAGLGALGSIAGALPAGAWAGILSSKGYKEDKKPAKDTLSAVRKMPVETWKYKEGIADGGASRHVGPYAEDFHKATGIGDGKTIPMQDMLGLTLGAIQDLDRKVSKMEARAA